MSTIDPNDEMLRATRDSQGRPMDAPSSSPEGRQEAEVALDAKALEAARQAWLESASDYLLLEVSIASAIRAYLSALPAPVAAVAPVVKDLQARLWNASGELAAHGGFDNRCRTLDEAAAALALILAKPAVEVVEALTDAQIKTVTTEYLSHRGERPYRVLRGGQELWEAHAPAMRWAFRIALQAPATPDAQTEVEK